MADLIDRDVLLKDLRSEFPESDVCFSHEPCIDCIVNRQPAVNRWIPVQERLPEMDKDVLVYAVRKDGLYDSVTTITQFSCKFSFIFISDYEITHWMPLPEPPEKE